MRVRCSRGQCERLAAGARAQVDDTLAVCGSASEHDQLAAFILNLDQAGQISGMLVEMRLSGVSRMPHGLSGVGFAALELADQ